MKRYGDFIYEVAGIRIASQKKTMLSNRLRRRLRATGIEDFDEYLNQLKRLPRSHEEWDAFLQEVSTHETYLFRDAGQWEWFQSTFLANIVSDARKGLRERNIRIWSAASSTGDEAHTVAACIAAKVPNLAQWKIEILGTDIGHDAVRQATEGVFDERAMHQVPLEYTRRFFDARPDGKTWIFKSMYKDWLKFRKHNLLDPIREKPFDLVFVKNVLIYFDRESKTRVLGNILPLIKPGGYLLTAAAEGVANLVPMLTKQNAWLFRNTQNK